MLNKEAGFQSIAPGLLEQVKKAVGILRSGGIVAYPTDTVYGLGSDVYNDEAVNKVFLAKNRPLNMPLPVLIADVSQLTGLAGTFPPYARTLMGKYWPGGLTIVFNKAAAFASLVLADSSKIAIRMPGHPVALMLIKELGRPISGTSANLHDHASTLTAGEVEKQLGGGVDFIMDAGRCRGGQESTIIDITVNPPAILRSGIIAENELMAVYSRQGN